ncbi:unnamed protein product [Anisakis simplex]|uniref:DUF4817 domain-containing protein n=1 Tax=Anisakis simplex TaxID=6269 RepID=A0A0M3K1R1_ANISI|nr:unnamed protein product [Anisakis simplex]
MCVLYGKAVKDSSDANDVPLYILKRCIREVQRKCALLTDSKAIAAGKTQPGFGMTDDKASDEEVRCIVLKLLANSSTRNRRRDQLISAVTKAVSGRFTIKDASQMEGLPVSTVHPYVSKARHMLGNRCPAPKGAAIEVEQAVNLARLQWCSEVDKRHLSSPSRSTSSSSSSCEGNSLQTYEDELMLYRNMNAMNLHENIAKNVKEVRIKYLIYLLVLRQYRRSFREQVLLSKALAHVLLDGLLVEEVAETNLGLSMYILKAYVKRCREVNHCIMQEFPVFRSGVRDLRIERQKNANLFHVPPEFDELAAASASERCIAKVKYDRAKREWLGKVLNGRVAEPMASYLQKLWAVNFPVGADLVQGLAQYTFRSVYPEVVMESDVWLGWVRDYCDEHGYLADSDI